MASSYPLPVMKLEFHRYGLGNLFIPVFVSLAFYLTTVLNGSPQHAVWGVAACFLLVLPLGRRTTAQDPTGR